MKITCCGLALLAIGLLSAIRLHAQVQQAWVARYNGPWISPQLGDFAYSVAVDPAGNAYVSGNSATIKYDTNGNQLWVVQNSDDSYWGAIVVDAQGNAYITAHWFTPEGLRSAGIFKYDTNGKQLWAVNYVGHAQAGYQYLAINRLVVDSSGNVFATGFEGTNSVDYVTRKLDTNGNEVWLARYSGETNGLNFAYDLALDAAGNVYVTGASTSTSGHLDTVTIKYDATGSQVWTARYHGPAVQGEDYGFRLALDGSGDVYVLDQSVSGSSLIKYDGNGDQLWATNFSGVGSGNFLPNVLGLDGAGNPYLAGAFFASGGRTDIATVKYQPNGIQSWVAHYNGIGTNDAFFSAMTLDSAGTVYVTGWSAGPGTSYDFVTVKYSTEGTQLWTARYNGPANLQDYPKALASDRDGNVYVAGNADASCDNECGKYATLKYDSNGNQGWVASYQKPPKANGTDEASLLALDNLGNVYVTGRSTGAGGNLDYLTVKYDSDGRELWESRAERFDIGGGYPSGLAVDSAGNVYVAGLNGLIKCDPNGNQTFLSDLPSGSFYSSGVTLDSAGNVLVIGPGGGTCITLCHQGDRPCSTSCSSDYRTAKYSTDGAFLWQTFYDGKASWNDSPAAVAVDGVGNVYVTGASDAKTHVDCVYECNPDIGFCGWVCSVISDKTELATVKYDANGKQLWASSYSGPGVNGPTVGWDYATAISVDTAGNVYVTGASMGLATNFDYATIKYSPSGRELWVARYDSPDGGKDVPTAIAVDSSGSVYITGNSGTVKYDANGNQLWVDSAYKGAALVLDSAGNLYLAGSGTSTNTAPGYTTIKYSTSGQKLWVMRYARPGNGPDIPVAIAVDKHANVYVTGSSLGDGTGLDFATVKYVQGPLLSATLANSQGLFQMTLRGEPSRSYTILASTDLTTWTSLTNFVSATGTNQFSDAAASNFSHRFYRAVMQ